MFIAGFIFLGIYDWIATTEIQHATALLCPNIWKAAGWLAKY